jgi:hypothetical protein
VQADGEIVHGAPCTRTMHELPVFLHGVPVLLHLFPSDCTSPRRHLTFAETDAAAPSVNVQVLRLLPPLEQAPDQIASRPSETLRVIDVPVANDADLVLPTGTLIPAGLEVTRSPLRPDADTVNVAAWPLAAGVTVNELVRVTLPAVAVIVTGVDVPTLVVVTVNVALVAP